MADRLSHRQEEEITDPALRAGELEDSVPPHGTLAKVRQELDGDRVANITAPQDQSKPVWIERAEAAASSGGDDS